MVRSNLLVTSVYIIEERHGLLVLIEKDKALTEGLLLLHDLPFTYLFNDHSTCHYSIYVVKIVHHQTKHEFLSITKVFISNTIRTSLPQ